MGRRRLGQKREKGNNSIYWMDMHFISMSGAPVPRLFLVKIVLKTNH